MNKEQLDALKAYREAERAEEDGITHEQGELDRAREIFREWQHVRARTITRFSQLGVLEREYAKAFSWLLAELEQQTGQRVTHSIENGYLAIPNRFGIQLHVLEAGDKWSLLAGSGKPAVLASFRLAVWSAIAQLVREELSRDDVA